MPATRHRFSQCGHKGFGSFCHRCAEATRLENVVLPTLKKNSDEFHRMKELVAHLRAPKKRNKFVAEVDYNG